MSILFSEPFGYVATSHTRWSTLCAPRKDGFMALDIGLGFASLRARYLVSSEFPVQVVGHDGLFFFVQQKSAYEMLSMLSEGSVRAYLREVLMFANWAGR